jgi:hypothetical protein
VGASARQAVGAKATSAARIYRARQSAGTTSLAVKKSSGVIIHGLDLRASPRSFATTDA